MTTPTWTLQDRIRKAREHAGLNQTALAKKLKVAPGTIQRWENGIRNPSKKSLAALAETTGVSVDWFNQDDANTALSTQDATFPPGSVVEWTPEGLRVSHPG